MNTWGVKDNYGSKCKVQSPYNPIFLGFRDLAIRLGYRVYNLGDLSLMVYSFIIKKKMVYSFRVFFWGYEIYFYDLCLLGKKPVLG
jgi:hypothetical protein